ncbi:hypothetical protein WSM22_23220 [Cytophagales bacterium WSM2-2]|nr:hypothetical protein WSM22_23220 [Cytophagales bacterium WSM2-2]
MGKITDAGRFKQGRGTGSKATWIPWHQTHDFGGYGRKAKIPSRLFEGRTFHAMSTIEANLIFIAEMAEGVVDLKEQFPLDLNTTKLLANKYGIKHPISPDRKSEVMTIDLWVEFENQSPLAISVKEISALSNKRILAKLQLEKACSELFGARWKLITNKDIPDILIANIRELRNLIFIKKEMENDYFKMIKQFHDVKKSLTKVNAEISHELRITRGDGLSLFKQLCAGKRIVFDYYAPFNPSMPLSSFSILK